MLRVYLIAVGIALLGGVQVANNGAARDLVLGAE